jgi:hypothetical protein
MLGSVPAWKGDGARDKSHRQAGDGNCHALACLPQAREPAVPSLRVLFTWLPDSSIAPLASTCRLASTPRLSSVLTFTLFRISQPSTILAFWYFPKQHSSASILRYQPDQGPLCHHHLQYYSGLFFQFRFIYTIQPGLTSVWYFFQVMLASILSILKLYSNYLIP